LIVFFPVLFDSAYGFGEVSPIEQISHFLPAQSALVCVLGNCSQVRGAPAEKYCCQKVKNSYFNFFLSLVFLRVLLGFVVHDFGAVNGAVGGSSWQKFGCGWEYLTRLAIATPL
jgi:hypothetical protein